MKPTVFIGSSGPAFPVAELVKAELGGTADAYHWKDDVFGLGRGTFESLLDALDKFDFAVLLFTPDDPVVHAGTAMFKPRDNVLIEFGLFTGGLGRDRTFAMIALHEPLHIPTDLAGVTVAELRPASAPGQRYDVKEGCKKIAAAIRRIGFRPRPDRELGVVYRMINALTSPFYRNVRHHAIIKAKVKYRSPERFESVGEVIDFLGDLLTEYVYPQLNPGQLETLRIYFAYYLGEGNSDSPWEADQRACWDWNSDGNMFPGEFVIGLANPTTLVSERDWRIGRAISGFAGMLPESMCASAFESGQIVGYDDERKLAPGVPNYKTPGELSVYSFPVEWKSQHGAGRIGVFTISSRTADSIGEELRTIIELLANIIGFLFSLYAVRSRARLEREGEVALNGSSSARGFSGISNTKGGRRFQAAVIGLRRAVAGYFERNMLAQRLHEVVDGELRYSATKPGHGVDPGGRGRAVKEKRDRTRRRG